MSDFGDRVHRALFGEQRGRLSGFTVAGRRVACPHCGNDRFALGEAQLNTAGMSFIGLDWANRSASTLACSECGHVAWFLQKPQRSSDEDESPR